MKKIAYYLFLLSWTVNTYAQNNCPANTNAPINEYCENGQGIRTDPSNSINNACPNLKNDFEWRVKHLPGGTVPNEFYHIYGPNAANNPVLVRNPFNGPHDANYHEFLTANHGSNYQPEDGWELLKVEFGALSNIGLTHLQAPGEDNVDNVRPKLPYMMLYNRYSGTLRFFGALMEPDNTYETVRIELRIPTASSQSQSNPNLFYQNDLKATNLLSIQGKSVQPLDVESDETEMSVFVKYTNNPNVFFWFDIPVAYDPCLCNNRSQLDVSFRFVQTADIDITGSISGTIKTETKGTSNYAEMVFGRILAAGVSGTVAIKTGGAVVNFKAFVDLVDIATNHPSRTRKEKNDLIALKNYLSCTADYAKILKGNYKDVLGTDEKKQFAAAQNIIDGNTTFLSSLVKGCSTGDKGATLITGDIKAAGTFTMVNEIADTRISLAMPGSKWSDKNIQNNAYTESNGKLVPAYPTYNERLGVFALIKTPRLRFFQAEERCERQIERAKSFYNRRQFSMKLVNEDIEYIFNPLLNVNPDKTTIQARFVIHKDAEYFDIGNLWTPEEPYCDPFDNTKYGVMNIDTSMNLEYRLATPYMPLDYLTNMPIRLSWRRFAIISGTLIFRPASIDAFTSFEENMFIQFKIVGESYNIGSDGKPNEFAHVFTYPVKFIHQSSDPNAEVNNKSYVNEVKVFDQNVTFGNTEDFYYTGPVIISAKLATGTGKKIRIYSLNGFEIEPGGEVSPDIELIVGPHFNKRPQPARTYAQVSAFCADKNKYKAQEFTRDAMKEEYNEYQDRNATDIFDNKHHIKQSLQVGIYPNPANSAFEITTNDVSDYAITLVDIAGRVILTEEIRQNNKTMIDISQLQNGIYFVQVNGNGHTSTQKIIVRH